MMYMRPITSDELYHHGIKGMKWGVRRYQNEDGSLKPAGEKHRKQREGNHGRAQLARDVFSKKYDKVTKKEKELQIKQYNLHKKAVDAYKKGQKIKAKSILQKEWRLETKENEISTKRWNKQQKLNNKLVDHLKKDKDLKPHIDELRKIGEERRNLYDEMMGRESDAYKKAYKEYEKKYKKEWNEHIKKHPEDNNPNYDHSEDIAYGFDHEYWGDGAASGSPFHKAYKEYEKAADIYKKQTIEHSKAIVNKLYNNVKNKLLNKVIGKKALKEAERWIGYASKNWYDEDLNWD